MSLDGMTEFPNSTEFSKFFMKKAGNGVAQTMAFPSTTWERGRKFSVSRLLPSSFNLLPFKSICEFL
jgi:hypothetical protein